MSCGEEAKEYGEEDPKTGSIMSVCVCVCMCVCVHACMLIMRTAILHADYNITDLCMCM